MVTPVYGVVLVKTKGAQVGAFFASAAGNSGEVLAIGGGRFADVTVGTTVFFRPGREVATSAPGEYLVHIEDVVGYDEHGD